VSVLEEGVIISIFSGRWRHAPLVQRLARQPGPQVADGARPSGARP